MTFVSLQWITPDAEAFIVRAARVSTSMENDDNDEKLLKYLADHQHWSPFEMAHACFYIETSRAVGRQILRHRSFSFQEFSQRYEEPEFLEPLPFRVDHEKNRQSSVEADVDHIKREEWDMIQQEAIHNYKVARSMGVAKEVARAILPEGLTKTKMFMVGNLRSWIHYLDLRCAPDTQAEHREVAVKIRNALYSNVPNIIDLIGGQ
jgi:thymidylate synthase (FAD)